MQSYIILYFWFPNQDFQFPSPIIEFRLKSFRNQDFRFPSPIIEFWLKSFRNQDYDSQVPISDFRFPIPIPDFRVPSYFFRTAMKKYQFPEFQFLSSDSQGPIYFRFLFNILDSLWRCQVGLSFYQFLNLPVKW